jgi:hypothetical protein
MSFILRPFTTPPKTLSNFLGDHVRRQKHKSCVNNFSFPLACGMRTITTDPSTYARMHVTTVRMYGDSEFIVLHKLTCMNIHMHTFSMCFQKTFWRTDPFWFRNMTTVPHFLAHVIKVSGTLVTGIKNLYLNTDFV